MTLFYTLTKNGRLAGVWHIPAYTATIPLVFKGGRFV